MLRPPPSPALPAPSSLRSWKMPWEWVVSVQAGRGPPNFQRGSGFISVFSLQQQRKEPGESPARVPRGAAAAG